MPAVYCAMDRLRYRTNVAKVKFSVAIVWLGCVPGPGRNTILVYDRMQGIVLGTSLLNKAITSAQFSRFATMESSCQSFASERQPGIWLSIV